MITWENLKEQNTLRMPNGNSHILLKAQKLPNINIQKVLPSQTTKLKYPGLLITNDRWWGTCCVLMGLDYCYFFPPNNFIYLWLCWFVIAVWVFSSSCGEWGLVCSCGGLASHYSGFSCCRVWVLCGQS